MNTSENTSGLPPGISPEEAARYHKSIAAQERAASEAVPGPLVDAFLPEISEIAGYKIRPVVAFDFIIMKKINSPLHRHILEMQKPKEERHETAYSDEEQMEMIYQFTTPAQELAEVLKKGIEHFQAEAMRKIGFNMNPFLIAPVIQKIAENFVKAHSTAIKFVSGNKDGPQVFTPPPTQPKTASDGGSIITAG